MNLRLRVEPAGGPVSTRDLDAPEITIGRSATADIVIANPSVSRLQAKLVQREGRWWIDVVGAANRTHLNAQPLEGSACLQTGDTITVGDTALRLVDDSVVAAPAPAPLPSEDTADVARAPRQAAWLRTVNDVHRALATAISLPSLLDLILERCFDVLEPEEGVILLRGPDGTLVTAASRRASDRTGEVVISRRIVDEVMGKAKPALVIDAAIDDRFAGSDSIMISGVRSVVAAPLIDAEGTLGLIMVCSRASVRQFNEQDLDMLVALASAAVLRVRNVALVEAAAARRVMDHELEIAHEMQMAMLPRHLPERPEIAVAARLQPARSVGGDLYDFILDGHRLWFIVGDVAGKSVAAALYMAVAKTLFRAIAPGHTDAAEVASRMNRELSRDNEALVFVTALLGWLDITTGEVEIVDAGHNPAVGIDPRARAMPLAIPKCVALGVVEDFVFTAGRVPLEAGAMLVLYTDGVTDARSTSGEMFGADRLERAIAGVAGLPPEALVQSIIDTVNAFAAGAPPEDDLTLLALQYRGN